ncbi:hypothetical protein DFS33DRAFT_1457088 [Desarmillaria ectypa]|nr:hypothetical protein DFS33DRAFT_1457088 [Desarmillaria ectypa]
MLTPTARQPSNLDARDRKKILTLGEIIDFYDNNQPMKQREVVEHFAKCHTDALIASFNEGKPEKGAVEHIVHGKEGGANVGESRRVTTAINFGTARTLILGETRLAIFVPNHGDLPLLMTRVLDLTSEAPESESTRLQLLPRLCRTVASDKHRAITRNMKRWMQDGGLALKTSTLIEANPRVALIIKISTIEYYRLERRRSYVSYYFEDGTGAFTSSPHWENRTDVAASTGRGSVDVDNVSSNPVDKHVFSLRLCREDVREICGAVLSAAAAQDSGPVEMRPTRKETLQAVMTVQKYIAEMDSSFAWQMETVLASFGRQTRLEAPSVDGEIWAIKESAVVDKSSASAFLVSEHHANSTFNRFTYVKY